MTTRAVMGDVVYRSHVEVERAGGPLRYATVPAEDAPVVFAWEFDADRTALTSGYSEQDLTNGGSDRFVDDFVCWGMLGDELLR